MTIYAGKTRCLFISLDSKAVTSMTIARSDSHADIACGYCDVKVEWYGADRK